MPEWPPISEPELLRRLTLDDARFAEFIRGVIAQLPARECGEAAIARALAYPWARPLGSYLLHGDELEAVEAMSPDRRQGALDRFTTTGSGRLRCFRSAPTPRPRRCGESSPTSPTARTAPSSR